MGAAASTAGDVGGGAGGAGGAGDAGGEKVTTLPADYPPSTDPSAAPGGGDGQHAQPEVSPSPSVVQANEALIEQLLPPGSHAAGVGATGEHACGRLRSFKHYRDGELDLEGDTEVEGAAQGGPGDSNAPQLFFQEMGTTAPFLTLVKVEVLDVCGVVPSTRLRKPRVVVSIGGEQSEAKALKAHTRSGSARKLGKVNGSKAKVMSVSSLGSVSPKDGAIRKLDTFSVAGLETHFEFEGAAYFVTAVSDRPIHVLFKQPNLSKKVVGGFFKNIVDKTGSLGTMLKVLCCPCHACFNALTCGGSASAPVAGATIPYGELHSGAQTLQMELLPAKNLEMDEEGLLHRVAVRTTGRDWDPSKLKTDLSKASPTSKGATSRHGDAEGAGGSSSAAGPVDGASSSEVAAPASKSGALHGDSRVISPKLDTSAEEIGLMTVRVTLTPLRGTEDGGNYNGPDVMMIEGRLRDMTRRPLRSLNDDNHWLCSHQNVFVVGGEEKPFIWGRFEYGNAGRAKNVLVHLFTKQHDSSDSYRFLDSVRTDSKGMLRYECPQEMYQTPGHYAVRAVVAEDNTIGHGSVFMLEKGTRTVVFDLDGTVNVGDEQMVGQMVYDFVGQARAFDAKSSPNGLSMCRYWAAMGYLPVYLTGRQGSFYNLTYEWLSKHGFPPGPVILTSSRMAALPGKGTIAGYQFVRDFKVSVMKGLADKGLINWAAYGNVGTDVSAYKKAGIDKSRTFIKGPKGGMGGTVAVPNFTEHMAYLREWLSESPVPTPWTALFF